MGRRLLWYPSWHTDLQTSPEAHPHDVQMLLCSNRDYFDFAVGHLFTLCGRLCSVAGRLYRRFHSSLRSNNMGPEHQAVEA